MRRMNQFQDNNRILIFRIITILFLFFVVLISAPSFGIADDGVFMVNGRWTEAGMFALSCTKATTKSTTVYADKELTQPIATVPAQTFAKDGYTPMDPSFYEFYDENGNRIMTQYYDYITPSGKRGAGWMNISAVASCYVKLDGGDGNSQNHLLQVKLGRVDYGFEASDDDPVWGELKGDSGGTNTGKQNNSSSGKTDRASSGKSSKSSSTPAVSRYSIMQGDNKENEVRVEVLALGSASSRIKASGATTEVATDDLLLDGVAVGDRLAWIYAPRQGYCSLRSKASDNGKVLKKCKAGYIVVVLEKGQEYTKINYQGTDGYVLNGCLKYIDETQQPKGTGTIIYSKKKPNVRTTINIRNNADGKSKKVAEWKTGTEVPVYSHPDGWYEVEYDGVRGYIMEKYLQLNE